MVDRAGRQLGNYRLLSLLGQGGFAEVYLGEHVFLKKAVAIKVLYTQLGKDDLEGFLREAQTIAHLEHPHIVRVTDFGLDGDLPYLVMEYAPNGTLRQRHPRDTRLPLTTISAYVKQVAAALQYAHDEKLVHRDIKPENMLLNRNNELLLSDFGLATVAHHTATQNIQSIAGTAVYMAPELFRGKSYAASDQYALGIVVYEWLTGQPPFNEGDFIQLGFQHSYEPPEPLSEKISAMPKDVELVVMTALAKDPKQRFGSVKAFANALEQACMAAAATQKEEEAESAPPPVLSAHEKEVTQQPSVQSQPILPSSLPLPAIQQITSSQPAQLPTQSMPPLKNSSLSPTTAQSKPPATKPLVTKQSSSPMVARQTVQSGLYSQLPLTQHAPQKKVIRRTIEPFPLPKSVKPKQVISRRNALIGLSVVGLVVVVGGGITWFVDSQKQGALLYTYTGHSDGVDAVAWSPNGQRIASGSYDGTVQVWNATDGSQAFIYTANSHRVTSVAWSPNGQRIASGSYGTASGSDSPVQVWNATDGSHVFIYAGIINPVDAVAWSPNGQRIASGYDDSTVQVWNATNGSQAFTYSGNTGKVYTVAWSPNGQFIASGYDNSTVQVWNATDGSQAFTYKGHSSGVTSVAWSPSGQRIASGSHDSTVQVWNADGSNTFTYTGHSKVVNAVAWSPDGQHIASGSDDKTVQVWNAIDGSQAFTYTGHSNAVDAVAWSPDGQHIASGSSDKTVQVWKAV